MTVGHGGDQFPRVGHVVGDSRRLHQRRIDGESPDPGLFGHFEDLRFIRPIREQLNVKIFQRDGHVRSNFNPCEQRSGRDIVTASPPESSSSIGMGYHTARWMGAPICWPQRFNKISHCCPVDGEGRSGMG
jgi:hypothetical protein